MLRYIVVLAFGSYCFAQPIPFAYAGPDGCSMRSMFPPPGGATPMSIEMDPYHAAIRCDKYYSDSKFTAYLPATDLLTLAEQRVFENWSRSSFELMILYHLNSAALRRRVDPSGQTVLTQRLVAIDTLNGLYRTLEEDRFDETGSVLSTSHAPQETIRLNDPTYASEAALVRRIVTALQEDQALLKQNFNTHQYRLPSDLNVAQQPLYDSDVGNPNVTRNPIVVLRIEPEYSADAHKNRIEGVVTLRVMINTKGLPENIQVIHSLGHGLDEEAIAALKKWRFKPALKKGLPVASLANIDFTFKFL